MAASDENIMLLQLKDGIVEVEMLPDLAPNHVARIKELISQEFYDGLEFHRVIEGFMAQTGDPNGNGTGGTGKKINAEFSNESHLRGTVSMARSQNPNSADSQFFIVLKDSSFLDGNYTVWGRVINGMELIDNIKKGDENLNGKVVSPDAIITMRMKSTVPIAL
jgi:peptidylprolyl isomerase